ncbi:MAG: rhodanese-like domain-containing protein [Caldilineaceae bacterium]
MRNWGVSRNVAALLLIFTLLLAGCTAMPQIAIPMPEAPAAPVAEAPTAEPMEEPMAEEATGEVDLVAAVDAYLSAIPDGFNAVGLDALKEQMDITDVYLVDVRTAGEYAEGHIESGQHSAALVI